MNKAGSKHLTLSERIIIQQMLFNNKKLKEIADELNKDKRTIAKEIRKHRNAKENGRFVYGGKTKSAGCSSLSRFPYVCNGCKKKKSCTLVQFRYEYDASLAQKQYEELLHQCRQGLNLTLQDKVKLDALIKNGSDKGQSIAHIMANAQDKPDYSVRSVYRMIDKGQSVVQNIDLIRKVKLKPRKKYCYPFKDKTALRNGRSYEDFISYISINGYPNVVEIDTVEGEKEGKQKCLLTIHFNSSHFTMAFLLKEKTSSEVSAVFISLQKLLGKEIYRRLFPVILTDRGSEFINPTAIESDCEDGEILTHVFFCNSYASYQKGSIEQDHELIRRIIPKGFSMNDYSQNQINLMMSHVNSYYRESISCTPYKLFEIMYGKEVLEKIKVSEIAPDLITLKPKLLK